MDEVLEGHVVCIKIQITEFTAPKLMSVYGKSRTVRDSLYKTSDVFYTIQGANSYIRS
jgi:hypothetical protein